MKKRLLVIGAGPTGLVAASEARTRGLDVTVVERDRVGSALARWGRTRFFTPFEMNLPPAVRDLLGRAAPPAHRLLLGSEMVEEVLEPLAAHPHLAGSIRIGRRVVAVGRAGLTRGELAGHPLRSERPFRAVLSTPAGEEVLEADAVVDASGANVPAHFGPGGLPAIGESELGGDVLRHLGDLERALPELAGSHILVIGHGHSAATAILRLAEFERENRPRRVTWVVRSARRRPCVEIASDPLAERQRTASAANDLADSAPEWLSVERRASVEEIGRDGDAIVLALTGGRTVRADTVAAFTGYRPDSSFLSELAIESGPATEGSARLERALSRVTDCLTVPQVAPTDFETGEPGFFFAGARSYGRSRNFLLRTGFAHLSTMLDRIAAPAEAIRS
jgi:thioredoxin reductase